MAIPVGLSAADNSLNARFAPDIGRNRSTAYTGILCHIRTSEVPSKAARQLPDLSITIRVEPSSTGNPRLRGALPISDFQLPVDYQILVW